MKRRLIGAILLVLIGVGIGVVSYIQRRSNVKDSQKYDTSDAKRPKGEINIALDNWVGYFPLQSPVFKKLMRDAGYVVNVENDNADYAQRMQKLKKGELDFAVATVDSYLLSGAAEDFPATIISIIDESKGGDALLAWEDKISSLDALKTGSGYKIAFTPDSPSEHLLKSLGVHFGITELLNKKGGWRVETDGSSEALKRLLDRKVDAAVLWEPDVSKALTTQGVIKVLGTENTEKLIVDILLVNREYSEQNLDVVNLFLTNYFQTLKIYNKDQPQMLEKDLVKYAKVEENQVKDILNGVRWIGLLENTQWFGTQSQGGVLATTGIVEAIESAVEILVQNGDFQNNPLPNEDPYIILSSGFVEKVSSSDAAGDSGSVAQLKNSLERTFSALSDQEWGKLKEIGTLKLRPITFMSGTSEIDSRGKIQLGNIVENVKHYPNFRIVVEGHTGVRGDNQANLALSLERAEAVKEYLAYKYTIDSNRMRAIGRGGNQPLSKKQGESSRAYNTRLKRVELRLVAEEF